MQWDVRGAWKSDGADAQMNVEATTQQSAEHIAIGRGMLVSSCWPVSQAPQQAVKSELPDQAARSAGLAICAAISAASIFLALICAANINKGENPTQAEMAASDSSRGAAVICSFVGITFGLAAASLRRH